jgi:ABC-type glycerol-3-phosphate transport system permease component
LFITIVVTLLVVYTSTICGFVLSKYKFKGRNILFGFVLATMMIPWCVTIIPKYTMIQKFGWMDSYKALIIPAMFSGFGIFMMKQHIETIPDEIIEAARMDGANEFYIFHRIFLPLNLYLLKTKPQIVLVYTTSRVTTIVINKLFPKNLMKLKCEFMLM